MSKEGNAVQKVNVILAESTLNITQFNSITSQLHIEVSTVSFPDKEWSDLSGSVLAMWLLSLNNYIQNNDQEVILYFMDDDYSIKIERLKTSESFIHLIDSTNNEVFGGIVDLLYFGEQLLIAANKVIKHFHKQRNIKVICQLIDLSSSLSSTLHNMKMRNHS